MDVGMKFKTPKFKGRRGNTLLSFLVDTTITKMSTLSLDDPHGSDEHVLTPRTVNNDIDITSTKCVTRNHGYNKEKVPKRSYHKPGFPGNRRLLLHRARNCECDVCYREIYKLPPAETRQEYVEAQKAKLKQQEIKRAKKLAKKEVKTRKQSTIDQYF